MSKVIDIPHIMVFFPIPTGVEGSEEQVGLGYLRTLEYCKGEAIEIPKWAKLFLDITNIGNQAIEEFGQLAPEVQVVEIQRVKPDVVVLVYMTLENTPLTNSITKSLWLVFCYE